MPLLPKPDLHLKEKPEGKQNPGKLMPEITLPALLRRKAQRQCRKKTDRKLSGSIRNIFCTTLSGQATDMSQHRTELFWTRAPV